MLVACAVASFIRKVPTASGARAVQIVHKQGRRVVGIRAHRVGSRRCPTGVVDGDEPMRPCLSERPEAR